MPWHMALEAQCYGQQSLQVVMDLGNRDTGSSQVAVV